MKKKKSNNTMTKRNDSINKQAILEAGRFNQKVRNWRNSENGKKFAQYNDMTSDEYMAEVRKVVPTALTEKDWHAKQEIMYWLQQNDFFNAFHQELQYLVSLKLEILKMKHPEKYERIMAINKEVKENEDARIKDESEKAEKDGSTKLWEETMANKLNPMTAREKTTFFATNDAAMTNIFGLLKTLTEIELAEHAEAVEKLQNEVRMSVKENVPQEKAEEETPVAESDEKGVK